MSDFPLMIYTPAQGEEDDLPDGASSLDYLQAIYRSPNQPDNRRMRAAIACLPFEHPKLSVNAHIGPNIGFARGLERARDIRQALANGLTIDGDSQRINEPVGEANGND